MVKRRKKSGRREATARSPMEPARCFALRRRDGGSSAPHSGAADNGARSRPYRARRGARRATDSADDRRDAGRSEVDPGPASSGVAPRRFAAWSIAAREKLDGKTESVGNGYRNRLKRLNLSPGNVWPRKPRSHKMWYTNAGLIVRSGDERWRGGLRGVTVGWKWRRNVLKRLNLRLQMVWPREPREATRCGRRTRGGRSS